MSYDTFNFDLAYPDAAQELVHLCTFAEKKQLTKYLAAWTAWIIKNENRVQFTKAEYEEWEQICSSVNDAHPLRLKAVQERIGAFWTKYQSR